MQEYFSGTLLPSAKPGIVITMGGAVEATGGFPFCWAGQMETASIAVLIARQRNLIIKRPTLFMPASRTENVMR